ncbi:DUF2254 domain-containing protein [Hymenobacter sp. RP-2-7]|uniref:DUF2254 domain-containing protein n=1 Tax=Hymenobacter polaris TaxID=2682546 RepID=A0A7Y0AAM4_9BACT|nr:DUF2254 domain-containing protein [Hymenobacter polaris]NML63590.1 DUF2254 domain-containing protein [Hymenobacter polaris]
MNKLQRWWSELNSSLWFVPTIMVTVAMLLAYLLVNFDDTHKNSWMKQHPLLFGSGAAGARGMLSSIASSMITVAGLIFSLTLSTLAQVSSQYTSRLLRNFMRDRTNQVVMGFFVGIFVYCLIVLRTIRGSDEGDFVPSTAISFALVLALVSIGMLIAFIHHIASSIQAANVVGNAADETHRILDKLFPKRIGYAATHHEKADLDATTRLNWHPVVALQSGYVQGIDDADLLKLAQDGNLVVRMELGIGSFAAEGAPLVSVASYDTAQPWLPNEKITKRIDDAYGIGRQRTIDQDFGFGVRQIVDIALKALSPGINDTSTGVMCLDRLGALLALLTERELGEPLRADNGRVRLIAKRPDFAAYLSEAFDQIRASSLENLAIYLRTYNALLTIAGRQRRPGYREALLHQSHLSWEAATKNLTSDYELKQVRERFEELQRALA